MLRSPDLRRLTRVNHSQPFIKLRGEEMKYGNSKSRTEEPKSADGG